MGFLLDTPVVLWWLAGDPTLGDETRDLLEQVVDAGFVNLPITPRHAMAAGRLPLLHRDPFDRMLIAQAGLTTSPSSVEEGVVIKGGLPDPAWSSARPGRSG